MKKLVILTLGAAALAVPATAFADNHEAKDNTALGAATHSLTGASNDTGWDAMTPQATKTEVAEQDRRNTIDLKFTPYARYEDVGDLEHDGGDVDVSRFGMDLRLDYIDEGGHLWAFRYGWEESDYDIDDTPFGSAAEDALDDATVWSLSLVHQRRIDEHWSAFGGFGMQFGGADGVSFSDGRNFMGAFGGLYDIDENLSVGLGLLIKEDFDDSTEYLPIPMLTYKVDDRTVVRVRGPRADIAHSVDDRITLRGFVALESRAYRVDDDVVAAPDGVVYDSHVLVGGGADFAVNEWFTVRGEVGIILKQEYEIDDDRGHKIDTIDGDDTGLFVGLAAIFAF